MRSLCINQEPVYFREFVSSTQAVDSFGNYTGEPVITYGNVKECMLCVAPNKSQEAVYMFGSFEDYDKPASTSDKMVTLDENSIVWLGLGYVFNYSTSAAHAVGDLCIHGGKIYRCISASVAGVFNPDKWAEVPNNAICKKRAPWKNSIAFALKDVDVK